MKQSPAQLNSLPNQNNKGLSLAFEAETLRWTFLSPVQNTKATSAYHYTTKSLVLELTMTPTSVDSLGNDHSPPEDWVSSHAIHGGDGYLNRETPKQG